MAAPTFTRLGALAFVHDFVLTRSYCVYFLSAVSFRIAATLFGLTTPVGSLSGTDDAPATLLLVPRSGAKAIAVPAPAGFMFHFANGFEDARGNVVLDGMRMDTLLPASAVRDLFAGHAVDLPATHPTRYVVDPVARTATQTRLSTMLADLPTIDPRRTGRPYRHFWSIAGRPGRADPFLHCVLHFDHEGAEVVRDFGVDHPGEPLFVPAPNASEEGQGWVLCLVYRSVEHRSDLYVLRPGDLGTICRLELPHHVPPGFHGTWAPAPPG